MTVAFLGHICIILIIYHFTSIVPKVFITSPMWASFIFIQPLSNVSHSASNDAMSMKMDRNAETYHFHTDILHVSR